MIDDKKIEEAATVASISDTEKGRVREGYVINALADHENGFREGYIEGAKWAINEFLKNLWHPNTEEPKHHSYIMFKTANNGFETEYIDCSWERFVRVFKITQWLYVEDLLSKKGGENDRA